MTPEKLNTLTRKELAELAKTHHVTGWHGMRKHQLVDALARLNGNRKRNRNGKRANGGSLRNSNSNGNGNSNGHGVTRANGRRLRPSAATGAASRRRLRQSTHTQDRLRASALDASWIHAEWQLTSNTVERAQAALGTDWHQAQFVLRMIDVTTEDSSVTNQFAGDIEIRGETEHWYIPVPQAGRSYKLHLGFLAPGGRFITLARSNRVNIPAQRAHRNRNSSGTRNGHGRDQHGATPTTSRSKPIPVPVSEDELGDFQFSIDTEVTIVGSTIPGARLTILGETICVREDGSFSLQVALAEGRQVVPAVAVTPDGAQERTIILAMERNVKELEPQALDGFGE